MHTTPSRGQTGWVTRCAACASFDEQDHGLLKAYCVRRGSRCICRSAATSAQWLESGHLQTECVFLVYWTAYRSTRLLCVDCLDIGSLLYFYMEHLVRMCALDAIQTCVERRLRPSKALDLQS